MTPDDLASGRPLLGTTLGNKYVIDERVGEGTMGWVYRARQRPLKRTVALKVMRDMRGDDQMLRRFTREAEVIAQLEHPNTITLYDFGATDDGHVYLVMKYVQGQTLRNLLDDEGAIPLGRAVHILEQVCGSLGEAHAAGITHRDVKPANIMLSDRFGLSDVVTVVDFGVAKDADTASITGAGQIVGTPAYMAPELASGGGATPASDVYSLGCMLYEMLTGAPPFGKLSAFTMVYKHVNMRPPPLPQEVADRCGPRVGKLLDRLLHKQPQARPDCPTLVALAREALDVPPVPPRPKPRERLRTMARMQAMGRRRRAHQTSAEFETPDLAVPEGSGRSTEAMLDATLAEGTAEEGRRTPRRPPAAIDLRHISEDMVALPRRARTRAATNPSLRAGPSRQPLPLFERPQAEGRIRFDEHQGKVRVAAVGMARLSLQFPAGTRAPKEGTACQVGLPGDPVVEGLIWVDVVTTSYSPKADGVYVDAEIPASPTGPFRSMVQYWSLKSRASS